MVASLSACVFPSWIYLHAPAARALYFKITRFMNESDSRLEPKPRIGNRHSDSRTGMLLPVDIIAPGVK